MQSDTNMVLNSCYCFLGLAPTVLCKFLSLLASKQPSFTAIILPIWFLMGSLSRLWHQLCSLLPYGYTDSSISCRTWVILAALCHCANQRSSWLLVPELGPWQHHCAPQCVSPLQLQRIPPLLFPALFKLTSMELQAKKRGYNGYACKQCKTRANSKKVWRRQTRVYHSLQADICCMSQCVCLYVCVECMFMIVCTDTLYTLRIVRHVVYVCM